MLSKRRRSGTRALVDPEFSEAAEAQGRPVAHQTAAEASATVEGLIEAQASLLPTLEEISSEVMGN